MNTLGKFSLKALLLSTVLLPLALLAKVNINTAGVEELQTLKGIGAKKAADIVAYREANGGFKSVDELANVKGIGKATVEKLADEIVVEGEGASTKRKSSDSKSEKTASEASSAVEKTATAKQDKTNSKTAKDDNLMQQDGQSTADKAKAHNSDKAKAKAKAN